MGCAASSHAADTTSKPEHDETKLKELSGGTLHDYHQNLKSLSGISEVAAHHSDVSFTFALQSHLCFPGLPAADFSDDFLRRRECKSATQSPTWPSLFTSLFLHRGAHCLLTEMEAEHCYMTGHDEEFECSLHYESKPPGAVVPKTTAEAEWKYVMEGKVPHFENLQLKKIHKNRKVDIFVNPVPGAKEVLSDVERLGLALYTGPMVCFLCPCVSLRPRSSDAFSSEFTTASCVAMSWSHLLLACFAGRMTVALIISSC